MLNGMSNGTPERSHSNALAAAQQVVAADGSCTSLGHAACNQFRIILDGKAKIG